jgi:hypothetical protein
MWHFAAHTKHHLLIALITMKMLTLPILSLLIGIGLAAPTLNVRSSCQVGGVSIGPVSNAGDAACSISVRSSTTPRRRDLKLTNDSVWPNTETSTGDIAMRTSKNGSQSHGDVELIVVQGLRV